MSDNTPVYSIAIPVDLVKDSRISASAKILYGVIESFQRRSGVCFASNERLAQELGGCTARTVSKCVGELKEAGYIQIDNDKTRKIQLRPYASDGQGGGRKLLPPEKKNSIPLEENFQGGGRNFLPSNTFSDIIPPIIPPEGGVVPKGKKSSRHKNKAQAETLPARFDGFWMFYRQHMPPDRSAGNRQRAIRAWDNLVPDMKLADTLAKSLAKQVRTEAWQSGIGVPHASTWLNNRGWEDDWGPEPTEDRPDYF